jgi:hypothetical protein
VVNTGAVQGRCVHGLPPAGRACGLLDLQLPKLMHMANAGIGMTPTQLAKR